MLLFFFASPKKNQKKSPTKDYFPFVGSSSVDQLYIVISDSVFQCSARIGQIIFLQEIGRLLSYNDLALTNLSVTTEEPQPDRFRRRRNSFDAPAYQTKDAGAATA